MDAKIKEQILNLLKKNNLTDHIDKIKFIKINDNLFKMTYNYILITYIEINSLPTKSSQSFNWTSKRPNFIPYIRTLITFEIPVLTVINLTDEKLVSHSINSIKNQSINFESYIILMVKNIKQRQIAIDFGIDFLLTDNLTNCLSYIRGNFTFIKNVMIINSNDVLMDNWIGNGLKTNTLIVKPHTNYAQVINDPKIYAIQSNSGIILNKGYLNQVDWRIIDNPIGSSEGFLEHSYMLSTFNSYKELQANAKNITVLTGGVLPFMAKYPIKDIIGVDTSIIKPYKIIPKIAPPSGPPLGGPAPPSALLLTPAPSQIITAPTRFLPNIPIQIPTIKNTTLIMESRINHKLLTTLSSPNKILIIILVSTNLDPDILNICITHIKKQSIHCDIVMIIDTDQETRVEGTKIPYYSYQKTIPLQMRINKTLGYIKNLNPNYLCFIEDSHFIIEDWIELCIGYLDKHNCDIVGSDQNYTYVNPLNIKYKLELIPQNLNFIDTVYRDKWSFFSGRMMSKGFLDKLEWNIFSNNFDVDIDVSIGMKLRKVGAKIAKVVCKGLNLIGKEKFTKLANMAFIKMTEITNKSPEATYLHTKFNTLLGKLEQSRIPVISAPTLAPSPVPLPILPPNKQIGITDIEISIVMPTLNGWPHIQNICNDIFNQTYQNYELIIVNDGSTQTELKEYLAEITSNKVRIVNLEKNQGLPHALNVGIKESRGKYWTWISDDNNVSNGFLSGLKNGIGGGRFVYSNYIHINRLDNDDQVIVKVDYSLPYMIDGQWNGMPSYLWRKDLIDEIGYFDETIQGCEDYDYVLRTFIAEKTPIHINDVLFTYYKRNNTLTTRLAHIIPKLKFKTRIRYAQGLELQKIHQMIFRNNQKIIIVDWERKINGKFGNSKIIYIGTDIKKQTFITYITHFNIKIRNIILICSKNDPDYKGMEVGVRINTEDIAIGEFNFDYFNQAKIPLDCGEISRDGLPIIGYYGDMEHIDWDLVKFVAELGIVKIVMIQGPSSIPFPILSPLVQIIPDPGPDLVKYISKFNLFIIPYKLTAPVPIIKMREMYATGKIVIISGDIRDLGNEIFFYEINDLEICKTTITNILKNCDINKPRQDHINYALKYRIPNTINIPTTKYTILYPPLIQYDLLMQRPTQFMRHFGCIEGIKSIFVDKNYNAKESYSSTLTIINKNTFLNHLNYHITSPLIYYYTSPNDIKYKSALSPIYTIFDLIDNPTEEFEMWNNDNLIKSIKESDLFICSAPIMYEKYKKFNKNTILVSNGCDFTHFNGVPQSSPLTPSTKLIIGYYGSHASWVDYELIKKIANYNPDKYTVVMIGKTNVYNQSFNNKNITWIPHVPYNELPKYLNKFDICMIPFKLTEMIKGCDPIKFYEYLATGKPILTTKMEPIIKYEKICYFIDHNNYGSMIDKAAKEVGAKKLSLECPLRNSRIKTAKDNDWNAKVKYIYSYISKGLGNGIKKTILYPPYISWFKMIQRPQQMMTSLAGLDGVRGVFIDFTLKTNHIINNKLILCPNYEMAKEFITGKVILYFNNPATAKELNKYKFAKSVFELVDMPVDEFSNWEKDIDLAINKANYISITAPAMSRYVKGKKYKIIPNGADYLHFNRAKVRLEKPADFPITNKRIIGYYGAHAPWVDFKLIEKIANIGTFHIVMIGKMEKVYNLSFEHSNITWIPLKEYNVLPYYLSHFDICMIPFKLTEMIKGCDPIKFYEYCSAGKPVIATKMEELQKFKGVIHFIDHDNYKEVIQGIEIGKWVGEEIGKNNSWGKRAKDFMDMIEG